MLARTYLKAAREVAKEAVNAAVDAIKGFAAPTSAAAKTSSAGEEVPVAVALNAVEEALVLPATPAEEAPITAPSEAAVEAATEPAPPIPASPG